MPKFNGGVHIDERGYLRISAGPHRGRRVHEMIAEAMMGRELKPDEQVHHRNSDKLDCDWRNLEVLGINEHGAVSSRQAWYFKLHDIREKAEWDEFWAEANRSVGNHESDHTPDEDLLGDDAIIVDTIESARAEAEAVSTDFNPTEFTDES